MLDGGPNGCEQAKDKAQDIETKALQVWTSDLNSQLVTRLPHNIFCLSPSPWVSMLVTIYSFAFDLKVVHAASTKQSLDLFC